MAGIKSDRWIRQMAREAGLIDPFEERQVARGQISYGLSSFGYDMRVADEFKIFTNVNSAIIDPKRIDESAFVEHKGDTCIVPPNSFALARSVEKFKIPRSVLSVVLGKSTYARCFRGDTRVALADGSSIEIEEMARRGDDGELFWGYGLGPHGRVIVALLDNPRFVGRDALIEVVLDNGEQVCCTPDHKFIRRDGRVVEAHELRPDDRLMPLYRTLGRGYEMVYQPLNGFLYPTHRLADEWNLRNGVYEDLPGTHRHHRDHDRRNNNPWNIERVSASEHLSHHNGITYGEDFDPIEHGNAIREALERLAEDDDWAKHFSNVQRERALSFWNDDAYAHARALLRAKQIASWTPERRAERAEEMRARFSTPTARREHAEKMKRAWASDPDRRPRQREVARKIRLREEITAEDVRAALDETGSIRGAARLLDCDRSVFRRFPEVVKAFRGVRVRKGPGNHKVVAIRELPGEHDVFCLTVPEAGNFALDAGVFVENCGIVVNVTPLEPEWEGYVTLEISNTTPLPAKIYANEGLCQVLFFESDEPCETSYADRKGKYQNQPAQIVLPRLLEE